MVRFRYIHSLTHSQAGFTVVEVLVAALLLALGAVAVLAVMDASTRNAYRAEQSQVAINVAQRELEKLRQLEYEQLALTAAPSPTSADPSIRPRMSATTFALAPDGSDVAPLVVAPTGAVDPGPTPFTLGDVSGDIYRFVVWRDEPGCTVNCAGTQDYKRIAIAIKLDTTASAADRPYQEIQSDFGDPQALVSEGGTGGGSGTLVTAEQLYLSDSPCSTSTSEPPRTEPAADHPTHDTLSTCGSAGGKPDAMLFAQPNDSAPGDPSIPGTFDYASDIEPGGSPSQVDRGLQMLRQATDGCNPAPGGADAAKRIHSWVSRPFAEDFVATGTATLELYTRTIGDANVPGAICMYLFRRKSGSTSDTRTAIPLTAISAVTPDPFGYACQVVGSPAVGSCRTTIWPRGSWGRVRFSLRFASNLKIPAGERIELALSVERSGTPEDALEFMYDHPDYPSRLEVQTATPVSG